MVRCNDSIKFSLCIATIREWINIVILGSHLYLKSNTKYLIEIPGNTYKPLWADICDCSYVILACQDKFVVESPFWFMIKYRRWMQIDNLIVFDGYVMPISFQMSHLIMFRFLAYDDNIKYIPA
jgi:hypothetical protein